MTNTPRLAWQKPYGGPWEGDHPETVYASPTCHLWGIYPEADGTWTVKTRTQTMDPKWDFTTGFESNVAAMLWCEAQLDETDLLGEQIANRWIDVEDYPFPRDTERQPHPHWVFDLTDMLTEQDVDRPQRLAEQIVSWSSDFARAAAVGGADGPGGMEWRGALQRFLAWDDADRVSWLAQSDDYRLVQCHLY